MSKLANNGETQLVAFGKRQVYYVTFETYTRNQSPWITSNCNAISFVNQGASTVTINNVIVLAPNDFFSVPGEFDELDQTQYTYTFSGSGTNLLAVVKKNYV